MTYNEYWYGDPLMARDYYRAFRIRRKQEDERMWLQGLYVLQALQATVGNLFLSDYDHIVLNLFVSLFINVPADSFSDHIGFSTPTR